MHAAAFDRMQQLTRPVGLTGSRDWDLTTVDGNRIVLTPTESGAKQALTNSLTVARDVVRRRIDPGGTKEITVINQGERRIFVQVPGVEDPEALKTLIGQTARLEFKLVDLTADPNQVAQGRAPQRPVAPVQGLDHLSPVWPTRSFDRWNRRYRADQHPRQLHPRWPAQQRRKPRCHGRQLVGLCDLECDGQIRHQ